MTIITIRGDDIPLNMPLGINANSSREDIEAAFGNPSRVDTASANFTWIEYGEWRTGLVGFSFENDTGVMTRFSFDYNANTLP